MSHLQIKYVRRPNKQKGVMLIEALIAILVFSLGILAMVGMQAVALGHTSQAKYRADASFAANKLFGLMWVDADGNMPQYKTGGTRFTTWMSRDVNAYLPTGRSTATVNVTFFNGTPIHSQVPAPPVNGWNVDVRIEWRAPHEKDDAPPHVYQATTTIVRNTVLPPV